jgi:hypothetical protein
VARTYKTLSLSLHPDIVKELAARGKATRRVAARVAAEIVLHEIANTKILAPKEAARGNSWCCAAPITPVQSQLALPETPDGKRCWVPVVVLLCSACHRQMHGREYEGWLAGA